MVRVLYPGSFDPPTSGHVDLVERALNLFEEVTVAVAANAAKQPLFSVEERCDLLAEVLPRDPRLKITSFSGLVVDYCRTGGFGAILRGLRTVSDFEYEYQMALTNRHMDDRVETVFVMPSARYSYVSSSLIKDIVRHGGPVSDFLPGIVEQRIRERMEEHAGD